MIETKRRNPAYVMLKTYAGFFMAFGEVPIVYGLMQDENMYRESFGNFVFDPSSLIASGVLEIQAPPLELSGRNVLLGFLDTGIRYDLDVFRRSDGSTRILRLWDQEQDRVYREEEINEALLAEDPYQVVPAGDPEGHGTAIASVAAGSRLNGGREYVGAAPGSGILFVKLRQASREVRDYYFVPDQAVCYSEDAIIEALEFLDAQAGELGLPLVICFGLGTNLGAHSGDAALEQYMNHLAFEKNRVIINCCGNEGNKQHHFAGRFLTAPGDAFGAPQSSVRRMEFRVSDGVEGFTMTLWAQQPFQYQFVIRSPGGEVIRDIRAETGAEVEYGFVYDRTVLYLETQRVERRSGAQLLFLRFQNPTGGLWTVTVSEAENMRNSLFHAWLPISDFLTAPVTFLEPSPDITLTIPSTAANPISVSTYDDLNGSFYTASGRGYTRDGRAKPDLAAPGVNVSTALGKMTGSSIAAAITAGSAALFMEWAVGQGRIPDANTIDVKNYLIRGAVRESDITYPSKEWGYGRLNLGGTFRSMTV